MDKHLSLHQCIFQTITKVSIKVKEIEKYQDLRLKASITHFVSSYVAQYIEESGLSKKQKKSIDQSLIVTQALTEIYTLLDSELNIIRDHMEHDHDNKLIKRDSNLKKGLGLLGDIFTFLSKK